MDRPTGARSAHPSARSKANLDRPAASYPGSHDRSAEIWLPPAGARLPPGGHAPLTLYTDDRPGEVPRNLSAWKGPDMSTISITTDALVDALNLRDLTDPAHGPHAMQLLVEAAVAAPTGSPEIHLVRTPPLVSVQDHYDRLGYPADAIARDARYTRYLSDGWVLRGHTSAGIPPTLRGLAARPGPDDVLVALPGICHRRDAIDRLHTGSPHQLDLWRLHRGRPRLGSVDLERMVDDVVTALLPGRTWRWTSTRHPYTRDGRQIDVVDDGKPVEVGECGLAAPPVLAAAGLDPRHWSGLALGIGLDRILMLRKGIPDIRLLRSEDPRIMTQMLDLSAYRLVSDLPPARRDLSVTVAAGADTETLGDRIREALGRDADLVEEVAILASTPHDDVPAAARERLGMLPGQDNVLLRVILRPMDRTMTADEANAMRDRIYAALHEGTRTAVAPT
jgi:phenylalanyl-tRNA synthetase alpha chain